MDKIITKNFKKYCDKRKEILQNPLQKYHVIQIQWICVIFIKKKNARGYCVGTHEWRSNWAFICEPMNKELMDPLIRYEYKMMKIERDIYEVPIFPNMEGEWEECTLLTWQLCLCSLYPCATLSPSFCLIYSENVFNLLNWIVSSFWVILVFEEWKFGWNLMKIRDTWNQ